MVQWINNINKRQSSKQDGEEVIIRIKIKIQCNFVLEISMTLNSIKNMISNLNIEITSSKYLRILRTCENN